MSRSLFSSVDFRRFGLRKGDWLRRWWEVVLLLNSVAGVVVFLLLLLVFWLFWLLFLGVVLVLLRNTACWLTWLDRLGARKLPMVREEIFCKDDDDDRRAMMMQIILFFGLAKVVDKERFWQDCQGNLVRFCCFTAKSVCGLWTALCTRGIYQSIKSSNIQDVQWFIWFCFQEMLWRVCHISSAMNLLVAGSSSCFLEPPNERRKPACAGYAIMRGKNYDCAYHSWFHWPRLMQLRERRMILE